MADAAPSITKDDIEQMSFSSIRDLWSRLPWKNGGPLSADQKLLITTACEMIQKPEHNTWMNRGRLEEIRGFVPLGEYDTKITTALAIAKAKK